LGVELTLGHPSSCTRSILGHQDIDCFAGKLAQRTDKIANDKHEGEKTPEEGDRHEYWLQLLSECFLLLLGDSKHDQAQEHQDTELDKQMMLKYEGKCRQVKKPRRAYRTSRQLHREGV
jgi:hypothetical protein